MAFKLKPPEHESDKPKKPVAADTLGIVAVSRAAMDDAGVLLGKYEHIDPAHMKLVPPYLMGIDIQGVFKSGKSTLMYGNPRGAVAHLPDGQAVPRRCRASVFSIKTLVEFRQWMDDMMEYAKSHGIEGKYATIGIDPTYVLYGWLMREAVDLYNKQMDKKREQAKRWAQSDERGGRKPLDELDFRRVSHPSEIPGTGPYGKVGDMMDEIITRITAHGWGWQTATHYKLKVKYQNNVPSGTEWKSDIPDTSSRAIAKLADILVVTTKKVVAGERIFTLNFQHERIEETGSRVPIQGSIICPNYDETDVSQVVWDEFCREFRRAQKRYVREQEKFAEFMRGERRAARRARESKNGD